jgi:hypothetical protein
MAALRTKYFKLPDQAFQAVRVAEDLDSLCGFVRFNG